MIRPLPLTARPGRRRDPAGESLPCLLLPSDKHHHQHLSYHCMNTSSAVAKGFLQGRWLQNILSLMWSPCLKAGYLCFK